MGIEHFLDSETEAESQDSENEREEQSPETSTETQSSEADTETTSSVVSREQKKEFLKNTEDKPYSPWISKTGTLTMFELEPQYVKESISTDLKDAAKERGLLYFEREKDVIIFTGKFTRYHHLIDEMGLDWCIEQEQQRLQNLSCQYFDSFELLRELIIWKTRIH
ncbi:hypothetical protein [Halobellus sp. EA9]|uniref:hypothetical protein n=1 Tax=Halobellus sp. EA9 TaxID=3421647 RepID=UPI003EBFD5E1